MYELTIASVVGFNLLYCNYNVNVGGHICIIIFHATVMFQYNHISAIREIWFYIWVRLQHFMSRLLLSEMPSTTLALRGSARVV